jgi:hypothetical protein
VAHPHPFGEQKRSQTVPANLHRIRSQCSRTATKRDRKPGIKVRGIKPKKPVGCGKLTLAAKGSKKKPLFAASRPGKPGEINLEPSVRDAYWLGIVMDPSHGWRSLAGTLKYWVQALHGCNFNSATQAEDNDVSVKKKTHANALISVERL